MNDINDVGDSSRFKISASYMGREYSGINDVGDREVRNRFMSQSKRRLEVGYSGMI